jgi:hypothetical protein
VGSRLRPGEPLPSKVRLIPLSASLAQVLSWAAVDFVQWTLLLSDPLFPNCKMGATTEICGWLRVGTRRSGMESSWVTLGIG